MHNDHQMVASTNAEPVLSEATMTSPLPVDLYPDIQPFRMVARDTQLQRAAGAGIEWTC